MPRISVSAPSVMISGDVETFQTTIPLIAPIAPPTRMAQMNASVTDMWVAKIAASTEVRPSSDPIERSMLPVMIRTLVPTAARPMNEAFISSTLTFGQPQNRLLCRPVATNRASITSSTPMLCVWPRSGPPSTASRLRCSAATTAASVASAAASASPRAALTGPPAPRR